MADESVRLACEAVSDAQRNVVKAQEVVERYEAKIQEIEEEPDFSADNPLYTNFINRLKDAKGSLDKREESLRQCREYLKLLNMKSSGGNSGVPHHLGQTFIVSKQYEDAKKYLFAKADHLESVLNQAVAMKEQVKSLKFEMERFVFVEPGFDATSDERPNLSPFFHCNGEGATHTYTPTGERIETGLGYKMHTYDDGSMHRVPSDWRMPRCNVRQLWQQWWIGDKDRQLPPLRFLANNDVKHIDEIPLTELEMKGRKGGKFKFNRRPSGKVLSDMKFLMNHITAMVQESGAMEEFVTPSSVERMFEAVSRRLILSARDDRKKWISVQSQIRANRALLSKHLQSPPAP